ncbi:MAG TPA: hypothetical protein DDZ89_03390, partial [Clostridiales bacterium]|nr:hypothetical protein [Clostridiales bacterium]
NISFLRYRDDDHLKDLQYSRIKFIVSESFIRGGFSDYRDQITEEFKKVALEKTNTEITFVFAEETIYSDNIQLRINSGLEFDVFLGFEGIQTDRLISSMFKSSKYWIEKGVAMDLTDYITPKYENLYNRFEEYPVLKEIATYNGRIYSLPSGIQKSERPYVLVRDDLMEKYGTGPLETMEDLFVFLGKVNADHTEAPYYMKSHFTFYDIIKIFAWEEGYYILPGAYVAKTDDQNILPVPIEKTNILDKASDYFQKIQDYYLELDDSVEVGTILAGDRTALFLSKNPEEYHYETAGNHPNAYTFQNLYSSLGYNLQIPNEINLMIYEDSTNKERTLTILNWLGNSNQAYDILAYGVEGVNYDYKDRIFQFNEETEPALGWMQRINGFIHLEKDFSTDEAPYTDVLSSNIKSAYINPLDNLLVKNTTNMNTYLDRVRKDAALYGSRASIISKYTETATRKGTVDVETFKRELAQQNNTEIEDHLKALIQTLKNGD